MSEKQRYKITVEYDGTRFCGWQKQSGLLSIQEEIEKAIFAFSHEKVEVTGSGRTDAGVHAIAQVAHFDLEGNFEPYKVLNAINYHVRKSSLDLIDSVKKDVKNTNILTTLLEEINTQPISITSCEKVDNEFSARFSATKRYYKYLIVNRREPISLYHNRAWQVWEELNIEAMQSGAQYLLGKHDFTSFRDSECQAKSPVKTLDKIEISRDENDSQLIIFEVSAKSFMHHMVRNIIGTLKDVGSGKIKPEKVKEILEEKNRSLAGQTAPACGLYFVKIEY